MKVKIKNEKMPSNSIKNDFNATNYGINCCWKSFVIKHSYQNKANKENKTKNENTL